MKKNHYSMISILSQVWKCKTLLVMRLTLLICLFFALQSIAIETFSQNKRLSINQKNIKIEEIIQLIENKTDYYFMYSAKSIDVDRTVDIEATYKLVPEILDYIFNGTNVSYKIDGRLIALSKSGEQSVIGQQPHTISGKVTDSSGAKLPGVSVVVKGTTTGVITDMDGKYSLPKIPENAILQFSFVGMKSQEIAVGGKTIIDVVLAEESIGIEEVVAIGYGTMKKSDITGSVTSVNSKDFVKGVATNALQLLSGKASGVNISQANSEPGGNINISVRGAGSINSSNSVLVVIDGLPGGSTSNLNPSDIESIEILKDASAAAIYGTRAANGVVLITTKKGVEGVPQISYNTYCGKNGEIDHPFPV